MAHEKKSFSKFTAISTSTTRRKRCDIHSKESNKTPSVLQRAEVQCWNWQEFSFSFIAQDRSRSGKNHQAKLAHRFVFSTFVVFVQPTRKKRNSDNLWWHEWIFFGIAVKIKVTLENIPKYYSFYWNTCNYHPSIRNFFGVTMNYPRSFFSVYRHNLSRFTSFFPFIDISTFYISMYKCVHLRQS